MQHTCLLSALQLGNFSSAVWSTNCVQLVAMMLLLFLLPLSTCSPSKWSCMRLKHVACSPSLVLYAIEACRLGTLHGTIWRTLHDVQRP